MVAPINNIIDFFDSTQGMNYRELILFAEKEATRAERLCLSGKGGEGFDLEQCRQYADSLKKLIYFFRYGFRPAHVPEDHYELFRELCQTVSRQQREATRCEARPDIVL